MKFVNYTVVFFSFLVALGITAAHLLPTPNSPPFFVILLLVLLLSITWFISRKQLYQNVLFGSIAYLCFFVIGYFNYQLHLPDFESSHYSHHISEQSGELLELKVVEVLKPDSFNHKYISQVKAINGRSSSGRVLLSIQKDSLSEMVTIDDLLVISSSLKRIPKPLNPHQFDYSKYMRTLNVYHQTRVSKTQVYSISRGSLTLRGQAERFRNFLLKNLEKTSLEKDERAILQALVLGQKKEISKELYSDYAAAGAVHILAVSGLHVGILFFIFSFILKPLKRLPFGTLIQGIVLVLCLWGFAFITGLSPSVTRAVTMFSFFAFAKSINRDTNSINTLFLSFFVLLLVNPLWLFHVGFQLSYLAVLSILLIQPKLRKYYRPRFYLDKLFWDILSVSFAAQLGVLPLSIYYFHQFPGLFFITNIVVLPVLGILLGSGLLIVCLAAFQALPEWLATAYNFLISTLNQFITWIANQERFLFEDIHFSIEKLAGSYLCIVILVLLWKRFNYRNLVFGFVSFSILIGIFIWGKQNASETEFIIFHKSRKSLLGYKEAEKFLLFRSDSVAYKKTFPIKGYRIARGIDSFSEEQLPRLFRYRQQTILVLDSLGVFPKLSEESIILLTQSPKVNLERLIDSLRPQIIVADGSNYHSYVSRWRKTCKQKKLPFHHTGKEGAFIIE